MKPGRFEAVGPEQKAELEGALERLNLIGAVHETIRQHRVEDDRLSRLLREMKTGSEPISAPEGTMFVISSYDDRFEVSTWHRGLGSYDDSGWNYMQEKKFDRTGSDHPIFLATRIESDEQLSGFLPGGIYAYTYDRQLRCKISSDRYRVSVLTQEEINTLPPEGVVSGETLSLLADSV